MTTGIRAPGDFCWFNILTPDPEQAKPFFNELFGWTYLEMPGIGDRIQVEGHDAGGLFNTVGPSSPPGTLPGLGVVIKVTDADAAAARITALGGKSLAIHNVFDQGRMVVALDPSGVKFDLWQPLKGPGTDVDTALHGAPSWFELLTTDAKAAQEFYCALFGWTTEAMEMPGGVYTMFKMASGFVGGMAEITPAMAGAQPQWGTYFTVQDVDATVRRAGELGGTVFMPAFDVAGVGRMCGIISPQGVMFYAITYLRQG